MDLNFSFNSDEFDLWEVYEVIQKYYPIGLQQVNGGTFFQFKGQKELEAILIDNIHKTENYRSRWTSFTKEVGRDLKKKMNDTTQGQAPSFSSSIMLKKEQAGNCIYHKELHFSVSLIGPFYQIYGKEWTLIMDQKQDKGYWAINAITASPIEEYEETFKSLEKQIQVRYPSYRMIPYGIGQLIIRGLQVGYLDDEDCTINKALFNYYLGEEKVNGNVRGDQYYGIEQWKR